MSTSSSFRLRARRCATRSRFAGLLLACVCLLVPPSDVVPAAALGVRGEGLPSGWLPSDGRHVLVRLAPGVTIERINRRYGTRTVERLASFPVFLLRVSAGETAKDLLAAMALDVDLEVAEPNRAFENPEAQEISQTFADPALGAGDFLDQNALARIRAPQAQALANGRGVIVAVLDTGVDLQHPRLAGRIALGGVDLVDGDADPDDTRDGIDSDRDGLVDEAVGHGTFVSGLILAVAPRASILPVRILDSDGIGTAFDLARGIEIAHRRGARVVNMSLGMNVPSHVVDGLIGDLKNRDVVFVASAGNQHAEDPQQFPARDSHVIGTVATDRNDRKANFSNFGSWTDVSAPGKGLVSLFPRRAFATWSGTSFAAALVSGEAALVVSARPAADHNDVVDAILESADPIDHLNPAFDDEIGSGRIDVLGAVRAIRED